MQDSCHLQIIYCFMSVPFQDLGYKETNKPQIKIPYRPESDCPVSMATSIVPQLLGSTIALAFLVAVLR